MLCMCLRRSASICLSITVSASAYGFFFCWRWRSKRNENVNRKRYVCQIYYYQSELPTNSLAASKNPHQVHSSTCPFPFGGRPFSFWMKQFIRVHIAPTHNITEVVLIGFGPERTGSLIENEWVAHSLMIISIVGSRMNGATGIIRRSVSVGEG